jgi:hypothetical protein
LEDFSPALKYQPMSFWREKYEKGAEKGGKCKKKKKGDRKGRKVKEKEKFEVKG